MRQSNLIYTGYGQKHLIRSKAPVLERKKFVPVLTDSNGNAKHVFPGLTLALSALRVA